MREAVLTAAILVMLIYPAAAGQHGLCFIVDYYVSKFGEQAAYDLAKVHRWEIEGRNAVVMCLRRENERTYRERVKRTAAF